MLLAGHRQRRFESVVVVCGDAVSCQRCGNRGWVYGPVAEYGSETVYAAEDCYCEPTEEKPCAECGVAVRVPVSAYLQRVLCGFCSKRRCLNCERVSEYALGMGLCQEFCA